MAEKSIYDNVVLMGSESFTFEILQRLIGLRSRWNYQLSFLQYEKASVSKIEMFCNENNVECYCFGNDKNKLTEKLLEYLHKTLVLSVRNTYLFPKSIVEKPNIDILNCHSALLPNYPGRNTPTWAILNEERISGSTWHWVNAGVDTGSILWQGECPIREDTKAYELVRSIEKKGLEGFEQIIDNVLSGTAKSRPQPEPSADRKVYLSKEVPENGHFSMSDDPVKIYRLLRCMDYGPYPIFPRPRTEIEGVGCVEITGYKKVKKDSTLPISQRSIRLPLGDEFELILKYREIDGDSKPI